MLGPVLIKQFLNFKCYMSGTLHTLAHLPHPKFIMRPLYYNYIHFTAEGAQMQRLQITYPTFHRS